MRTLRRLWEQQLHLTEVYLDRYELSGHQTRAAARRLRWSGGQLVGEELTDDLIGRHTAGWS